MANITKLTEERLYEAGWNRERSISEEYIASFYINLGLNISEEVRRVIKSYDDLHINKSGNSATAWDVKISSSNARFEYDRAVNFSNVSGDTLISIGEASGGHVLLYIGQGGVIYAEMPGSFIILGKTFEEALDVALRADVNSSQRIA